MEEVRVGVTGIRLAMLQLAGTAFDPAANRDKAERFCRDAAAAGADIALLPEMFNVAYPVPAVFGDPDHARSLRTHAESADGPFVSHFAYLAAELKMAIGVSYLERRGDALRNSLTLVDRHGRTAGTYSKFHTCRFQNLEYGLEPGEDFYVWSLDTSAGPVAVGAMICYDREFPESARILMLKGAEVVLVPNACTIEENRTNQLRTRAFENEAVFAMANYAAPNHNGHSVLCNYDGAMIAQAGEEEQVLLGDIDLDGLRGHQREGIWGISFRRPEGYGLLTRVVERPGYGAKTAKERAEANLKPVDGRPFEKAHAAPESP